MGVVVRPDWNTLRNRPATVVTSFNGASGAVTGVGSFNGATGAVTGVNSVNGNTGAVTALQVVAATASVSVADIGTYAFLNGLSALTQLPGTLVAGSSLQYSPNSAGSSSPSGTWRLMGNLSSSTGASVWMRVA